ncbi:MAG: thermonuclease family protein [Dehalococcoidia bacterium]
MLRMLGTAWEHFTRLPLPARLGGWLFLWPALIPLRILTGPPSRWRGVAAGTSFVVLGFVWSAMCAGAIEGGAGPDHLRAEPTPAAAQIAQATRESSTAEVVTQPAAAATIPDASATPRGAGVASVAGAVSAAGTQPPATPVAATWTVTRIIDGDTIAVASSAGASETVRIVGIDTPEVGQCGFEEAADALARLVLDQPVALTAGAQDDRDRYGRILRYVDVRGVDAGLELIRGGFAVARYDSRDGYGRHAREDAYVAADATSLPICEDPAPTTTTPAVVPFAATTVSTQGAAPSGAQVFANCAALREVYPGGVARVGVQGNTVSGELRPFTVPPVFDDALYQANVARDRDQDGVACER